MMGIDPSTGLSPSSILSNPKVPISWGQPLCATLPSCEQLWGIPSMGMAAGISVSPGVQGTQVRSLGKLEWFSPGTFIFLPWMPFLTEFLMG